VAPTTTSPLAPAVLAARVPKAALEAKSALVAPEVKPQAMAEHPAVQVKAARGTPATSVANRVPERAEIQLLAPALALVAAALVVRLVAVAIQLPSA